MPRRPFAFRASRLATASGGSLAVLLAGAGISYLAQVGTARLIGPGSFGAYAYLLAWTTLLAHAATLGFRVSLLRLLPAYRAVGDWPRARGAGRFASWIAAGCGCLVAAAGSVIVVLVLGAASELARAFLIGLWVIPLVAVQLVTAARVRAWGGVVSALVPERILRDGIAVLVLGLLVLWGPLAAGAPAAAASLVAAALCALAASHWMLRRRQPPELLAAPAVSAPGEWLRPTLPLTVLMLADVLMSRAGTLVLGSAGAIHDAGIFAVAYSLSLLAALPRMAIASAFAPTVSDLHARGERERLQALSSRAAQLSLAATLVVAVPLMLAAEPLLMLFGSEFRSGVPAVVVLVLAQLFAAACGPQQHLLTMTGQERAAGYSLAVAVAANLAIAALLVGSMGLLGAALASAASLAGWNCFILAMVWRRLGLRPGLLRPRGAGGAGTGANPPDAGGAKT
jgi:O-antigen/teichoic acid export membrane protein